MSRSCLLVLILTNLGGLVRAQDTNRFPESPAAGAVDGINEHATEQVLAEHRALVEQLGSGSFVVREKAASRLAELGIAAKPALLESLKHKDLEVRLRVHQILVRAMRDDFERRLAAFLADGDIGEDHRFPGWDRFREVAGHDLPARTLFAEMIRYESDLLEAFSRSPDDATKLYDERVIQLQTLGSSGINGYVPIEAASAASLLFVGAEVNSNNAIANSRMFIMLNQGNAKQSLMASAHRALLRRLLERWILARGESKDDYGLQLALTYDMPETCLEVSRRYLDALPVSTRGVPHAAIAVGRFGSRAEDFARLQRHAQNKTVCHTWSNQALKKEGVIEIQIRDVVLVMLLHLTKQDPKEFGFDLLQPNPTTMYHIYTFGFLEDFQREAAHAKWEAWLRSEGIDPAKE